MVVILSHFVVCADVIIDKASSEASYIRIIEEFATDALPFSPGRFFVCAFLDSDGAIDGLDIQINIISPTKLTENIGAYSIQQRISRAKIQVAVDKTQFKEFGKYFVVLSVGRMNRVQAAATIPLYIRPKTAA